MKRSSLFVFVLSLLTAANAQTPQQSPTPSSATSDDVVRISTNLIQLDVTVTGKSGKPISDLSRDEIKIWACCRCRALLNCCATRSVRGLQCRARSDDPPWSRSNQVLPSKVVVDLAFSLHLHELFPSDLRHAATKFSGKDFQGHAQSLPYQTAVLAN